MGKRNNITDSELERIKEYIGRFSYIDLIVWRNEMIDSGEINNRLFDLLNTEILNRAYEMDLRNRKDKSK